jgi:hypothetical protein
VCENEKQASTLHGPARLVEQVNGAKDFQIEGLNVLRPE